MSSWRMGARLAGGHEDYEFLYGNALKEKTRMKNFSDVDLTELADWAEQNERAEANPDAKKAYGAMRQGADWLLRFRVKQKQKELEAAGNTKTASGKAS